MSAHHVNIIGAGLAGCEAAWQVARRGIEVRLYEMKPHKFSPAHHIGTFAELVCSNSLRSDRVENAVGLLKQEMLLLDSLIINCALATRVPAGGALAVDRDRFSRAVTSEIYNNKNIKVINEEVTELSEDEITIVATGPLTSTAFSQYLERIVGKRYLYFFDAAAPIVTFDSIDMTKAFKASRYGKGTEDYLNCPMNREQYAHFINELVNAETVEMKDFEDGRVFEGCMPVETMAKRGYDTLRFGPLKPVGLVDPSTGSEPYAVVQLRQDNTEGTLFNIVGFQTHLKWPEQKRVFSFIPGLENAEFVRYGVMHRNTFINSPGLLDETYNMKEKRNIYFAGQITGVEGYVESASSGLVAGINAAMDILGKDRVVFPPETAIGALGHYISSSYANDFQPMNINFGIIWGSETKVKIKKKKNQEIAKRALNIISKVGEDLDINKFIMDFR